MASATATSTRSPFSPVSLGDASETDRGSFNRERSRDPSEDTVPARERWWTEAVERYARWKVSEGVWRGRTDGRRESELRAWPARFECAGLPKPLHAKDVTAAMVTTWKANPIGPGGRRRPGGGGIASTSVHSLLKNLRCFLEWAKNPVAKRPSVWRCDVGVATNRRWYDSATIDRVWAAAPEHLRPPLAMMCWLGLRRAEAWGVKVEDVNLALDSAKVRVLRKGGKYRDIPLSKRVANALRPAVVGRLAGSRLYPLSYESLGREIVALGNKVGIVLTCHDLRRSCGRILKVEFGVPESQIRGLYDHASEAMTRYYIGSYEDEVRATVSAFDRPKPARPEAIPVGV